MRSMRFWVTAMTRNRRVQTDSRQQSLDFGPVFSDIQAQEQQTVERTLRLLGSISAATDAELDAARMRSGVIINMLKRHGQADLKSDSEDKLSLLMFCVFDALNDGSLCVGKEKFKRRLELFNSTMQRRASSSDKTFVPLPQSLTFEELVDDLRAFGLVGNPGLTAGEGVFAGGPALLVAEATDRETLVYTQKSYAQEQALGEYLAELAFDSVTVESVDALHEAQRAADIALANRLTVISGGPGTGKTTAVVNILKCLIKKDPESVIQLAAPTGKAASRMKEAVANNVSRIEEKGIQEKLMGLEAKTLHRLLYTPGADGRTPSKNNPLQADIVVVDESSMIDIRLASNLFKCIDADRTKVILLGDRFQLAAVGPGSFFADVSDLKGPLADNISHLTKSWRFDASKALGKIAEASREGEELIVTDAFVENSDNDPRVDNPLRLHEDAPKGDLSASFKKWFENELSSPLKEIGELRRNRTEKSLHDAAHELARLYFSVGILASNREGPMSAQAVNAFAESIFVKEGIPYPAFRPMIVRRNDSMLEVYNGDIGVVMPGQSWFEGAEFDATQANVYFPDSARLVRFGLIGHIEPAFAITIHQSQGSEYHHVAVLMPQDPNSGLATRELFYTAVTRVRDERNGKQTTYGSLDVFGKLTVVKKALRTPVQRQGGLIRRIVEAKDRMQKTRR